MASARVERRLSHAEGRGDGPASHHEGGRRVPNAGHRKDAWTPWKDRIRSHRDALVHVEVVPDFTRLGKDALHRSCLLTASADGSVRLFELSRTAPPAARQKLLLSPPPSLLASGHAPDAGLREVAPEGNLPMSPLMQLPGQPDERRVADAEPPPATGSKPRPMSADAVQKRNAPIFSTTTAPAKAPVHVGGKPSCGSHFFTAFAYSARRLMDQAAENLDRATPDEIHAVTLFAGFETGLLAAWDGFDGRHLADLSGHELPITKLCTCGDGDVQSRTDVTLLSASMDGTVRGWHIFRRSSRVGDGKFGCVFTLEFGRRNPVSDLLLVPLPPPVGTAASPASAASPSTTHRLLAAAWDGRLRSIDVRQRTCTNIAQMSYSSLRAVAIAEDGLTTYVGTEDCHICMWNFPANPTKFADEGILPGKQIIAWKAHGSEVLALRLWKQFLISASEDRLIRLWLPAKATLKQEFFGHNGAVLALCIAQNELLLWTGGRDWTVRSWDLAEAERRIAEREQMVMEDKESKAFNKAMAKLAKEKRQKGRSPGKNKGKKGGPKKT